MSDKQDHNGGLESHLAALDSGLWSELESTIERFEVAWQSGVVPALADFLPPDSPDRSAALVELIATDLEWRWRSGLTATTEDYLSRFPELRSNTRLVVQLVTSEFIARRRAGIAADPQEFLRRFPDCDAQLASALSEAATTSLDATPAGEARRVRRDCDALDRPTDVPRVVGRYKLLREIGRGTFGAVYEAVDTELERRVAVKLPHRVMEPHSEGKTRLIREAQNLARLSHSAIVPVLDVGWSDGLFYIVCALVEGPTLADRLRDEHLPQRAAARIIATLGDALDHAHRQGVVHRDVKPSNVLFDAGGTPWLTDFGLASFRGAEATLSLEGHLIGTPAYMSPEQTVGAARHVDGRSDVYSLGVVLYESLTGQLPFMGSPSAVLDQIRYCEPLPPRRLNSQIDRDLETICLTALHKHPGDRYQSAVALGDDLRRYLGGEPICARPPGPIRRLAKWARRRPATAALLALALGTLLSVTLLTWWHNVQLRGALAETDDARRHAERMRLKGQQNQHQTENLLYAADVRLATNSYLNGDRTETLRRLRRYVPSAEELDRREFSWRRLWSLCHAQQQTLVGHDGDVYTVLAIGDDRRLATTGRDGTLRLWDLSNGGRAKTLAHYPDELGFAALSPDGVTLATGGDSGTVRLWNLVEGRETCQLVGHESWVMCGAISPRGNLLATSGRDHVIRLWSLPNGEPVANLIGHTSTVESLAYFPDGNSLVSTGADCSLRLWNLADNSGSVLATHPLPACCVACSHDGRSLATCCADYNIYVWDVATRSLRGKMSGHTEIVQSVAFSPDDTRLASAGKDGAVRIWDSVNLLQNGTFLGHDSRVWSVAWLPDGTTLASTGADGTMRLWNSDASHLENVASIPTEVTRVHYSVRDGRLWSQSPKQPAWIWDVENPPEQLVTPTGMSRSVASARNFDRMAVVTDKHQVTLFNGFGQPVSAPAEIAVELGSIALNSSGDLLAVSSDGGKLCVYELPSFRLRWNRTVPGPGTPRVEFTVSGNEVIIAGPEGFVGLYRTSDGSSQVSFRANQRLCVAASPDGTLLATGCSDRSVRLWNANKGTELACLQGHNGAVQAVTFSPDGQTLGAGTSAGSITLWHIPSSQELGSFKTSLAAVNDLAFSADGSSLAIAGRSVDGKGQVVVWKTKPVDD